MRKKYLSFCTNFDFSNSFCRFSSDRSSGRHRAPTYLLTSVGVPPPLCLWAFTPGESSFYWFMDRTANNIPGLVMKEVLKQERRWSWNEKGLKNLKRKKGKLLRHFHWMAKVLLNKRSPSNITLAAKRGRKTRHQRPWRGLQKLRETGFRYDWF